MFSNTPGRKATIADTLTQQTDGLYTRLTRHMMDCKQFKQTLDKYSTCYIRLCTPTQMGLMLESSQGRPCRNMTTRILHTIYCVGSVILLVLPATQDLLDLFSPLLLPPLLGPHLGQDYRMLLHCSIVLTGSLFC